LLSPTELKAAARRWGRRPGAPLLRSVLQAEVGAEFTRSHAERLLMRLIDGAQLPPPEKNVRIGGYLVDAVWRQQRLIVEIDGFATHGTAVAFAADRARDAALQAAGWRVLRFTYAQLRDRPMLVLAQLVRALGPS
jgi:very-short-patch-repair endonuclease